MRLNEGIVEVVENMVILVVGETVLLAGHDIPNPQHVAVAT